jgi:sugar diacid utilization regulator/GAF domain-containing protein
VDGTAVKAFTTVMAALDQDARVDDLLEEVAATACTIIGVRRCSIWLRDPESGLFPGAIANTGSDVDLRRLVAGLPGDGFTEEIVRTQRPVVVRDARHDPRPVRASMMRYGIQTMLGVPMRFGGEVIGLIFLDNEDLPHSYTDREQHELVVFADLVAIAVTECRRRRELRDGLDKTRRKARLLAHARAAEAKLSELLLEGAGIPGISALIAEGTGKPVAVCDNLLRAHGSASPDGTPSPSLVNLDLRRHADVRDALASVATAACSIVGPFPDAGIAHRHAVAPIEVAGERWGYVVVMERPSRLTTLDHCFIQRSASAAALELTMQGRVVAAQLDARTALVRELIADGPDRARLTSSAASLGVHLDGHQIAVVVAPGDGVDSGIDPARLASDLSALLGHEQVLATETRAETVLFVSVASAVEARAAVCSVKDTLERLLDAAAPDRQLSVGVSSAAPGAGGFARAYREAREVAKCVAAIDAPNHSIHVLAADDLGPARLLLARGNREEIDRFVTQVLGPVLDDGEAGVEMLRTLQCFFEEGRSARRSAVRLDVHENTVRYRLTRFRALTALDVAADPNDQLSVQVALLVLLLRGGATVAAA